MSESPATGDRLAKVIARSGLCSRRDAEAWIVAGRVVVNGKKVLTPAFNVTDRDSVTVDDVPLAARQGTRVWLYHKPAGLVVTEKDPEGRETIFDALAAHGLPRVVTVGRLDINTEGLLLLTNDGGLKRVLELPATGWLRRYRVRAHGSVTQAALDGLKNGIEIDGIRYGAIEAALEREQGANVWLTMALREGKNREVKNVLGALGLEVNRLIRVSYGPFQLADIPVGGVETVKARMLREQLGKRLAEEADVDFDSIMPDKDELVGTPLRERLTGRGTNTVEIAKQRFRFTDGAEKTEREIREEKPRQDRPGRFGAQRAAPAPKRFEDEGDMAPPRKIIFDDGRQEDFQQKTYGKKPGRDDAGGKPFGKGAPRGDAPRKSFDDKPRGPRRDDAGAGPKRSFADKPHGARPAGKPFGDRPGGGKAFGPRPTGGKPFADRGRPAGAPSDRPRSARPDFAERPKRDFGDRPQRNTRPDSERPQRRPDSERPRDFAPRTRPAGERQQRDFAPRTRPEGERQQRDFAPRTRPDNERTQSPHPVTSRPGRNFSEKPRSFRPDGGRPPRSLGDKPAGDRPARNYSERPANTRPEGERQRPKRDELGLESKTYGKPKTRGDGKPHPKRDGAAPARGPKPGGHAKPGGYAKPAGGRPSGGAGRPASGGRPSSGAGRPASGGRPSGGAGRPFAGAGRPASGGRPGGAGRPSGGPRKPRA